MAEKKLQQEQEDQGGFLQRPRETAPSPEPVPASMNIIHQQTQDRGIMSWEQYANSESLSQFGNLSSSNENQLSFNKATKQNPVPIANAPKLRGYYQPAKPTDTESSDSVFNNSQMRRQPNFGEPSPLRHGSRAPLWVRADVEMTEATPRPQPSLDDLYNEHPEKKLQVSIEPSTMNLAASVIMHVANEAGYQWFNKWCPGMNLREVFDSIGVEGKGTELAGKQYNMPPEATNTRMMTTSLAGMYRRCHDIHPKGSGDIQFPKLLKLVDECIIFLVVLKDTKHKTLLQKTWSMFKWIPIGLDAKRLNILKQARVDLEELDGLYKNGIGNSKAEYDSLEQKHQEGQLSILDAALVQLDIHRKTFETEMLNWLNVLLDSTAKSPSEPQVPEVH
ncbi:hypothetical protein F4801DRAFT_595511 [Xylaria longipes]|nr:hypothetical protein F4801DRAFT_595511 [Xylaria longipes]